MSNTIENNKRIAQNTLFLYCRQFITMAVSLYTVRVILDVLGTVDYGIYNVIGGIVMLFSFLSNTMSSATQRYLSFELGKEKGQNLKKIFSLSVFSYIILIGIIIIILETIGLWFVNNKLTIPETRIVAANFVYQSSILSFAITLLAIPYNAAIIAMERMNIYAYASVVDAILKLIIAWILPYIPYDHLKTYSLLMVIAISSVQIYYIFYCRYYFNFCKYSNTKDKKLLFSMISFACWNMIGALANILRGQGLNILINIFFTPLVNAAYSIAMQVNNAITNFTNNFYTAVRPQLVKLFAAGNKDEMLQLGYKSSTFAFYLILILSVPLITNAYEILQIWLKDVPNYTVLFLQIIILSSLIEVLSVPLANMLQASGKIKIYQLSISILYLLNIPISYIFLKLGFNPEITLWINLSIITISMIPRLFICKRVINLSIKSYIKEVLVKILQPTIIIYFLFNPILIPYWKNHFNLITLIIIQVVLTMSIILYIGLKQKERTFVFNKLKEYIK